MGVLVWQIAVTVVIGLQLLINHNQIKVNRALIEAIDALRVRR